ncbi:hypothetical protein [Peptoniphilus asaccharolyticus]
MKNKLLKFINVFLAIIILFSNLSSVFASANTDDKLSHVYKQGGIQKIIAQNTVSNQNIFNKQSEEDDNFSNGDFNDKKQSLDTEKKQLSEEDQFSIVNEKDMSNTSLLSTMSYRNNNPVKDTETIASDDIAPPNYLNLLSNMPGASATVEAGPGVNGNSWGGQKDLINLDANTQTDGRALWNGDW